MYCVLTGHLTCQKDFSSWRKTLNHRFVVEVTVHFLALVSQFFRYSGGQRYIQKAHISSSGQRSSKCAKIHSRFRVRPPNR